MPAVDALQGQLFSDHGRPENLVPGGLAPAAPQGRDRAQLPMFMPAGQLLGSLTATADKTLDDPDDVMSRKMVASKKPTGHGHGAGVHASVEREGVLNPVQMIHAKRGDMMMGQGHHRVAAAAEIERRTGKTKWVPVVHTDAREESDLPIGRYSRADELRAGVADYRHWSEHTTALGQDIGWKDKETAAATKVKKKIMAEIDARPLPKRTGITGQM